MKINKNFNRKNDNATVTVNYETIEECPNCKKALAPQNLYGIVHSRDDKEILSVADYCNGCHSLIVSEYEIKKTVRSRNSDGSFNYEDKKYKTIKINYSAPVNFKERDFDRKSLEFLIKDFAIYNNPES